jgi:sulfate/thiosulfate transport system ATP-binding protein
MSIEVRDVTKRFGDFVALNRVSLDVPEGGLVALLGPSGSGKSTLLRVLAGLERPDSGEVRMNGRRVTALSPQDRGIGFVFQHYAPFRHMTVWKNVAFALEVRHRPRREVEGRVAELLDLVQLTGLGQRMPSQLSGGQLQRMALARALAVEPEVLLLDEPFGALDARVRRELRAWLRRLHDEVRVTTVFVTHDQEEALDIADGIVVMNGGRVHQAGAPREVYEEPATDFVMEFIGTTTHFLGRSVRPHDVEVRSAPFEGALEAQVERVVYLGALVRLEMVLGDGAPLVAQVSPAEADAEEFERGQLVYVRAYHGDASARSVRLPSLRVVD